jgi:hypothetical protein
MLVKIPVGWKVKVREDLTIERKYFRHNTLGTMSANPEMVALAGQTVTINDYDSEGDWYTIEEDNDKDIFWDCMAWTIDMFEFTEPQKSVLIDMYWKEESDKLELEKNYARLQEELKNTKLNAWIWLTTSMILATLSIASNIL